MNMAIYHGSWEKFDDVIASYPDALADESMLIYASYVQEDYSGDAYVVFVENGVLYEQHEGHCSCNGLENWRPEATTIAAMLSYRTNNDNDPLVDALLAWMTSKFAEKAGQPVSTGSRAIRLRDHAA